MIQAGAPDNAHKVRHKPGTRRTREETRDDKKTAQ
jgi:hypothetical protein